MTERARRHDEEGTQETYENLPAELSHELAPERDTQSDLTGATAGASDEQQTHGASPAAEQAGAARPRGAARKVVGTQDNVTEPASTEPTASTESTESIESTNVAALSAIEADRIELEAQGFSPEEAQRLIDVSKRLETSAEARASQADLKRLRFAQWLVEHGILDEFSV